MSPAGPGAAALMTRRLRPWWQAAWLLVLCLAWGARADDATTDAPDDTGPLVRVKAGYLYKFGAFVDWPVEAFGSPDAPVVIGIVDADPLADELKVVVEGRSLRGREIAVRRLHPGESPTGIHVLFLGPGAPAVSGEPHLMLTVADEALPPTAGGMIRFVRIGGRLRFDVFVRRAEAAGLAISARLLAVAHRVDTRAP